MGNRQKRTPKSRRKRKSDPVRISYEIVPGHVFPVPNCLRSATYASRSRIQKLAAERFENPLLDRLNLSPAGTGTGAGGWAGVVNPSGQVGLPGETPVSVVRACMAALGLLWRQDAVASTRLRPDGRRAAMVIRKADETPFSVAELRRAYSALYDADVQGKATIGFTEVAGAMVFINAGDLTDEEFRHTIRALVAVHLTGEVRVVRAQADFELLATDWSQGDGEDYRRAIRDAGRSDLLDWLDGSARREVESFLEEAGTPGKANEGEASEGEPA